MKRFNCIERVVTAVKKAVAAAAVAVVAMAGIAATVDVASAQAGGGTIGAQVQTMAQEFSSAGGFTASMAMYVAALITFIGGTWFLWQSRQPENREGGKVAAGLAGLVLTGLFVTGGNWIGKAAMTTTGAAPTISSAAQAVTFQ